MDKRFEQLFVKSIMICFKTWLKPQEAMLYCALERSQFLIRCEAFGTQKSSAGYYNRLELDQMMSGEFISPYRRIQDLLRGSRPQN
jgi:hypothetical protein